LTTYPSTLGMRYTTDLSNNEWQLLQQGTSGNPAKSFGIGGKGMAAEGNAG